MSSLEAANLESALDAIAKARTLIASGALERAAKLLTMAARLCQDAEGLAEAKRELDAAKATAQSNATSSATSGAASGQAAAAPSAPNANIDRVLACHNSRDLYGLLNVGRTATQSDIKKAYKKTCLKIHPDKCDHPSATDAFKALQDAYETLSDEASRILYDAVAPPPSPPPPPPPPAHPAPKAQERHNEEEEEFTCSICFDTVDVGAPDSCTLPCASKKCKSHFHSACIAQWLHYRRDCPLCKRSVPARWGASSNTSAADGVQPPPQPPNVEDYFVYDDEYSDDDGLFSDEEPYDSEEDDYDEWWDSHEERRAERLFGRRRLDEQGFTADWELFVAEHAEWDRQFGVAWREKEAADAAERQRAEAAARAAADAEQLERSALHAEAASYVASVERSVREWQVSQGAAFAAWLDEQADARQRWRASAATAAGHESTTSLKSAIEAVQLAATWRRGAASAHDAWLSAQTSAACTWQAQMEQAAGAFQSTFAPAPASDLRRSVCREVLQQSRIAAMQAAEIAKNGARAAMRSARTLADEAALSFARGAIERIASNWRAAASEWAEKASGLTTSWAAQRAAVVDAWTSPMMDRAAAAATAEAVASIAIEAGQVARSAARRGR